MTAFVRRYSARIAAWICTVRGHEWTRYTTVKSIICAGCDGKGGSCAGCEGTGFWRGIDRDVGERKCKRCGKTELGPAPKKRTRRAPNAADTIQTKEDVK